ncbi:MAG: cytochrome c biogenesis CcdA family protein [Bacillota bacterium]|nr:cytochrome c biogenesis CcdA family protein [Bacillota bacterium]
MTLPIFGVFTAGFISFLSPCIIPLIPMYVGFLAGDLDHEGKTNKKRLLINSIAFLLGLMLVYSLLGATATQLGRFLNVNSGVLLKVAAVLIIFFGIFQLGLISPNFLNKNVGFRFKGKSGKTGSAFLLGMAFSFGWSPCIGPVLASVMALVASSKDLYIGFFYLIIYSIGFSIPFLITTFLVEPIMKIVDKSDKGFKVLKVVTAVMMIGLGLLMWFNKLSILTSAFS